MPTQGEEAELCAYSDASFAPTGTKSHGCSAVFYSNVPISWKSSRQPFVTLSTAESELVAASEAALLLESAHALVVDACGTAAKLCLMVDNQAAVSLSSEGVGSWRTRHLKLRYSWLREKFGARAIEISFVPGSQQRADLGTKSLDGIPCVTSCCNGGS